MITLNIIIPQTLWLGRLTIDRVDWLRPKCALHGTSCSRQNIVEAKLLIVLSTAAQKE
jgi:hypothetical protein